MSPDPNSISLKVKDLEVDLPTVAELEDFVRLSRLGKFAEAKNYFLENLEMYTDIFPVVAEKADTLLEQNLYGDLVEFVSSVLEEQRELQSSFGELSHEKLQQSSREHDTDYPGDLDGVFTGNELHLLELLQLKGTIHVTGSVNHVLEQMRHAKGAFTQEIGYSGEQDIVEIPKLDDTQIQIILKCIQIALFACIWDGDVAWEDFQLPWTRSSSRQDVLLALQYWCLNLIEDDRTWEATDVLKVLLQSEIPFLFRPPEAEEDIVETHAGQAKAGEEGAGQGGAGRTFGVQGEGAETEDVIDRDVFFNKFIEKLGNCQFNEGKLLSRFAAQEAYCTALQENGETEKAAEILDPLRLDIELLQQLDLEMKFSRQYLQWALHQNNLVREYNGLCVAPRLDEILPIAEKISDYPMQEDILHRLCGENRTQINLYWRYMRLREIISKRMQDTVLQVWQVCEETILVDEDGARRLEERRKSTLEDLLKSHEEFDVPLLRRGIKRILEEFPENPDVQPQEVKQPPAQGPLFSAT